MVQVRRGYPARPCKTPEMPDCQPIHRPAESATQVQPVLGRVGLEGGVGGGDAPRHPGDLGHLNTGGLQDSGQSHAIARRPSTPAIAMAPKLRAHLTASA